jgi:fructokinase
VSHPTGDSLQQLVARESGRLISLDPNIRLNVEPDLARWRSVLDFHARHAHLIKVSDEDLQLLYPDQPVEESARRWLGGQCSLLILTRGGDGVTVFSPRMANGRCRHSR